LTRQRVVSVILGQGEKFCEFIFAMHGRRFADGRVTSQSKQVIDKQKKAPGYSLAPFLVGER
jgi:hypothetical protein